MKNLIWYGATVAVVTVAVTVSGQSQINQTSSSSSSYIVTSKLIGRKVKSSEGEKIGVIKEVVIDRTNGCMAYTVVSTGGEGTGVVSGEGKKIVAVPWAVYSFTSDLSVLTVNVDRDKIYKAPPFDYARMDEYARPDYIDNIYSYYGVSPGPRTAAGTSSGATAGTDVTGTAGPTVSPGEVASPAPAATVAPNKTLSARMHAASAVTPDTASSVNQSRTGIRNVTTIGSGASHRERASPSMTEESDSENTSSPRENKRSRRKAVEDAED
ncbi:MAG: PRC-barrel domain-containing protein [Candidatus Udaeobacter sp.]